MKILLSAFVAFYLLAHLSYAQTNTFPSSGNVGIGTTAPTRLLHIKAPYGLLLGLEGTQADKWTGIQLISGDKTWEVYNDQTVANKGFAIYDRTRGKYPFVIDGSNGNVGIGTTNPGAKLHIDAGTIKAFSIETDNQGPWAFTIRNKSALTRGLEFYQGNDGRSHIWNNYNSGKGGSHLIFGEDIKLKLDGEYPAVTASGTNYFKQFEIAEPRYNIPAGMVDNGYRVGMAIQSYVNTSDFQGQLHDQRAAWIRVGAYNSTPTGTINNSYGIFLENLGDDAAPNVTINNSWGLYQSSDWVKNYFAGKVGIGISSPAAPLEIKNDGKSSDGALIRLKSPETGNAIRSAIRAYDFNSQPLWSLGDLWVNNQDIALSNQTSTGNLILKTNNTDRLTILANGNVGVGMNTPDAKLTVFHSSNTEWAAKIHNSGGNGKGLLIKGGASDAFPLLQIEDNYNTIKMVVNSNGNVGIGTDSPDANHKLTVDGSIKSKKVVVTNKVEEWPDYVFEKDYKLKSLKEMEQFIQNEKHLPGIPSAAEVKTNGIDLADMDARLLQVIEELTLHLIEMKKELESVKEKNEQLEKNINNK